MKSRNKFRKFLENFENVFLKSQNIKKIEKIGN